MSGKNKQSSKHPKANIKNLAAKRSHTTQHRNPGRVLSHSFIQGQSDGSTVTKDFHLNDRKLVNDPSECLEQSMDWLAESCRFAKQEVEEAEKRVKVAEESVESLRRWLDESVVPQRRGGSRIVEESLETMKRILAISERGLCCAKENLVYEKKDLASYEKMAKNRNKC